MSSVIFFLLNALVRRCRVLFAGTDWTSNGTGTGTSGIMGSSATRSSLTSLGRSFLFTWGQHISLVPAFPKTCIFNVKIWIDLLKHSSSFLLFPLGQCVKFFPTNYEKVKVCNGKVNNYDYWRRKVNDKFDSGKTSIANERFNSGIARKWGGGFTLARIFWSFFSTK